MEEKYIEDAVDLVFPGEGFALVDISSTQERIEILRLAVELKKADLFDAVVSTPESLNRGMIRAG